MKLLIINILLLLTATNSYGQDPLYKNFTTEDGLPSNEIYSVCQDSLGYIWLGTEGGLVQYNGKSFKTYTINDGLSHNVVLDIEPGIDNKVWAFTYPASVCYYQDGKVFRHPISDSIEENSSIIISFYEDEDSTIYINLKNKPYLLVYKNKKITKLYNTDGYNGNEKLKYVRRITKIKNQYFIYPPTVHLGLNVEQKPDDYTYDQVPFKELNKLTINNNLYIEIGWTLMITTLTQSKDGDLIFGYVDNRPAANMNCQFGLVKITSDSITQIDKCIDKKVGYVYTDNNANLFVCCIGKLLMYTNENFYNTPKEFFKGFGISCIIKDKEGNYWIPTTKNGLLLVPELNLKLLRTNNSGINKMTVNKDALVANTNDGQFYIVDTSFAISRLNINHINLNMLAFTEANNLLVNEDATTFLYKIKNKKAINIGKKVVGAFMGYYLSANSIEYLISTAFIKPYSAQEFSKSNTVVDPLSNYGFNNIYQDNDTIWLSSLKGLINFSNGKLGYNYKNPIKIRTNDVKRLKDGRLALCTKQEGLIIHNSDTTIYITTEQGLQSNIIHNFFVDGNKVWLSTASGLSMVTINGDNYSVKNYETLSTRTIGKISNICKFNNHIVLGTSVGICAFKEEDIDRVNKNIPITISNLLVNNNKWDISNKRELQPHENNIEISFQGFSYRSPNQVRYKYILEGYLPDTIYTTNSTLQYTNLPHGNYTFKVFASTDNHIWSATPAIISFNIKMHYTETWWFVSLLVLGGILIVSGIFLLIIRNLSRRSALQKSLLLSEQKALRAQMNPHFTFNALNSIQYFLTDNDRRSATTFLSKFSMLVRKVLYNSNNNLITLEEEVNTLKLYLELEALRFGDKLTVNIHIDDDIYADDILVPSMIIQPFLENAIWHGIMPKESGKGNLDLNFSLSNNQLVCKIKDNGIGREKSAELKAIQRKGHKSTGLKNIEERIKVLNHINESNISLKIIDIENYGGTEVIIYFDLPKE